MLYLFLLIFFLLLLGILLVILGALIYFIPQGAPYVRSNSESIKKIVALSQVKKGEKAVDLGSGDGSIVIALAQAGAEAHGYEINFPLVLLARWRIRRAGLQKQAFIHWKNMWKADLSSYSVVTIYGISYIMKRLEKKLHKELPKGARVICNNFVLPTWKPAKKDGAVWMYQR